MAKIASIQQVISQISNVDKVQHLPQNQQDLQQSSLALHIQQEKRIKEETVQNSPESEKVEVKSREDKQRNKRHEKESRQKDPSQKDSDIIYTKGRIREKKGIDIMV